ncbi:hypothetical protein DSM112329_04061 [Paraconexibacter sp. AEG42_29]|uniref:DUF1800 domain-containing protein n=1 Tax=Paraconexibacter sp. AEG42_29 TaxID=2997339 RepID=A0AAU7AZK5_9ACTN
MAFLLRKAKAKPKLKKKLTPAQKKALAKKKAAAAAAKRKAAAKKAAAKKAAAKKKAAAAAAAKKKAAGGAAPIAVTDTLPAPPPATIPAPVPAAPAPQRTVDFGRPQAERLLWRAGFGPRPGDVDRLVAMGLDAAVRSLVYPQGGASLVGPAPRDEQGQPLAPNDVWGHDGVWWLDRMVRSDQPLVERMTLLWHDWFATSRDKVGSAQLMLDQNALLRRHALGSFADLLRDVTRDPAMLSFLDGIDNRVGSPNENYAREVMELFTLGAGRGAYSEDDVRELARAFTGFRADWRDGVGLTNFRFDAARHDNGNKTVFGRTGNWGVDDGWRLCLEHPLHASFVVQKLWSAFIPQAPDAGTVAALAQAYVGSGHQIAPVVEAILKHPDLYYGERMVKAPVVFIAGLLRETGRSVDTDAWAWLMRLAGQQLFFPPSVAGWDESRWLDTSSWRGRWYAAAFVLRTTVADGKTYSATETPEEAVDAALAFLGSPTLTPEMRAAVVDSARSMLAGGVPNWGQASYRAVRQNGLRMLIATCSDHQTC